MLEQGLEFIICIAKRGEREKTTECLKSNDNFSASRFVFLLREKGLAKTKVGRTRPCIFMRPIFGSLVITENE